MFVKDYLTALRVCKKNKAAELTTDDLKFILYALRCVRTSAIRDFAPRCPKNGDVNRNCIFKFTLSSFLLHKISPEIFNELGMKRDDTEDKGLDIYQQLYSSELVEGRE